MKTHFSGKIWIVNDDIDTDIIIPTEYLALSSLDEMAAYAFSPLRPGFAKEIKPGDILVAGKNFGCGSSREQAVEVIKKLGVAAIIAKGFARIFYRNAINNGLLVLENPLLKDNVSEGDEIEIIVGKEIIHNSNSYPLQAIDDNVMQILECGGLVPAMKKRNGSE